VHGLSLSKVALLLGVMIGLGGALGNFLAGLAADRLSNRDMRWYLWVPAIGCLLSIPVVLLELNVASAGVAMGLAFLTAVLTNAFVPPTYALTQSLVHPRLRALGSSVIATGCNIVGGSLGPLVTGLISDTLLTHYRLGPDSLRYALCFSVVGMVVAVFLYLASAQSLLNRQKEGEPLLAV
jgi:MFS family permease